MHVLKFGGTSVANAENIKKVKSIIRGRLGQEKVIVIVSALGGVTDDLLRCSQQAADGDEKYRTDLLEITLRHLDTARELLPLNNQSSVLSFVVQQFNEMEDICNGIYLLREFSDKTRDRILSYGELISSRIIAA